MNKRITTLIIMSLVIAMGIIPFITSITRATPSLQVGWAQNPEPGWYGEAVSLNGYAGGGLAPYHGWDWNYNGIHHYEQNTQYTWYPTVSPTNYSVSLLVYDSHTPNWFGTNTSPVEIQIAYDVYINTGSTDKTYYSNMDPIIATVSISCSGSYHMCPYYNAKVEIYKTLLIPTGIYANHSSTNIPKNTIDTWNVTLSNPGSAFLGYYIHVTFISQGNYDQSSYNDDRFFGPFWVR